MTEVLQSIKASEMTPMLQRIFNSDGGSEALDVLMKYLFVAPYSRSEEHFLLGRPCCCFFPSFLYLSVCAACETKRNQTDLSVGTDTKAWPPPLLHLAQPQPVVQRSRINQPGSLRWAEDLELGMRAAVRR